MTVNAFCMKRICLMVMLCIANAVVCMSQGSYVIRTLTFEDSDYRGAKNFVGRTDWSSLIDTEQIWGELLYGPGMGYESEEKAYQWHDGGNTELSSVVCNGYDAWTYMAGGHAISHYGSSDLDTYCNQYSQLTIYNKVAKGLQTTGCGHNGSDNFAVHYGYHDDSGFSLAASPVLRFRDGKARVIDHMFVNNTCYALFTYVNGNSLTAKVGENDWVRIVATADNGRRTEFYLCKGPKHIVTDWTIWDLSVLGEVRSVEFNIEGSVDNGSGFSLPAYFAYDDVAVRFPLAEKLEGDMNGDGKITMDDVNILMNIYLAK